MDKQKDERARGVTISCSTKEFFTKNIRWKPITLVLGWNRPEIVPKLYYNEFYWIWIYTSWFC
jgi:hypothetical protein